MSLRSDPYPGPGVNIQIPAAIWTATLEVMRSYASRGGRGRHHGSEALVYYGGHIAGENLMVTTMYRLDHEPQGDSVHVRGGEARWLLRELRARDEKLIGQVHSHRGRAGHSMGDDMHATSFHRGFISIVVPSFGVGVTTVAECAVLEFDGRRFVEFTSARVDERMQVTPGVVARNHPPPVPDLKGGLWHRFVQRLRPTGRKGR